MLILPKVANYCAASVAEPTFGELLAKVREAKKHFDRIDQESIEARADLGKIECPVCGRKVKVINQYDIGACEHLIAELLKNVSRPRDRSIDPLSIKLFVLDP